MEDLCAALWQLRGMFERSSRMLSVSKRVCDQPSQVPGQGRARVLALSMTSRHDSFRLRHPRQTFLATLQAQWHLLQRMLKEGKEEETFLQMKT